MLEDYEAQLQAHQEIHAQMMAAQAEHVRVERWHATYNAALTGLLMSMSLDSHFAAEIDDRARLLAVFAHGKLVKDA